MTEDKLTWQNVLEMWDELRLLAQGLLAHEGQAHSVQPSGLVLTALRRQKPGGWETGFDDVQVTWENRSQFFGQMRRAMHQALIDHARQRDRVRQIKPVRLRDLDPNDFRQQAESRTDMLEALDHALKILERKRPEWATLVTYLYFGGLSQIDASRALGISEKTVQRWLPQIQVWLKAEIERALGNDVEQNSIAKQS